LTYLLAVFIIIGVKGLFHSDWLGAGLAASPIGPQLGEGETEKYGYPAALYSRGELQLDLVGFLDSVLAESSHDTPPVPATQLLHSSADPGQITSNC
jgi:hypothetical protein